MSKNILLAVDAASHDPARHVLAAAAMTRDLSYDSGDRVIVLHVHEFATGRFGRIQVDCGEGEGEGVVAKIVADLRAAGVSAEGEIRETSLGHVARAILNAAQETTRAWWCSARAAVPTCRVLCWAAWPADYCIWLPGRS
jgi:hypothetical protein